MLTRCYNPHCKDYKNYGERGIKCCDRWREKRGKGFWNFVNDMGERPKGCSIDRIDNNGDYCPSNCRWATPREQSLNQRERLFIKNRDYYERNPDFGVYYRKDRGTWRVQLRLKLCNHPQRCFKTKEEAIAYRNQIMQDLKLV